MTENSVWTLIGLGVIGADSEPSDDETKSGLENATGGLQRLKGTAGLCLCLSIAPVKEGEFSFFKTMFSA